MKYTYKISSSKHEEFPVIIIEGDMTSDADEEVKAIFTEMMNDNSSNKLIINFEKTKYINSSGIATLINIIQNINEKNGEVIFVGMSSHFKKVMDIVGITDFVQILESNDDAVKVFNK
jgi:anti-anti-sigma factor